MTTPTGRRRRLGLAPMCALVALGLLAACSSTSASTSSSAPAASSAAAAPSAAPAASAASPGASAAVSGAAASFDDARLLELKGALDTLIAGKDASGTSVGVVANIVAPFWSAGEIGTNNAAKDLGVNATFQAPQTGDLNQQLSMIGTLVGQGVSGLSISAVDAKAVAPEIDKAISAGTNVITMDSDAPTSERYFYLGTSNYNAGKSAGEATKELLGGKGKVAIMVGSLTAQNALDRIQGFKDGLAGSGIEVVQTFNDEIDPAKAQSNAETALQSIPDLSAFFCVYSYNGPAAANAVKAAGKAGQVKIVAFDAEPETLKALKDGTVQVSIGQRPYQFGYMSTYLLTAMALAGKDAVLQAVAPFQAKDGSIDTGVDLITADNLAAYEDYLTSLGISSQ